MAQAQLSRLSVKPIVLQQGVQVTVVADAVTVQGPKGTCRCVRLPGVGIEQSDGSLQLTIENPADVDMKMKSGTQHSLIRGAIQGVTQGWQKRLLITGVGYRAAIKGKTLALSLGFSHPVDFAIPEGIQIETPSATEIVVSGIDKQLVGQVATNIRRFRPVEPYKGKGIRYADEQVVRKQAKKK